VQGLGRKNQVRNLFPGRPERLRDDRLSSSATMSHHHDPPPAYPNVFACVILSQRDLLRIYGFLESIKEALNATIVRCWSRGIQEQRRRDGTWEWKLRGALCYRDNWFSLIHRISTGTPWSGQGDQAVPCVSLAESYLSIQLMLGARSAPDA
jgi:hypothetical protein